MDPNLLPNAGQYPITRHLPKTGQTTVYNNFDDGHHQAGWWRGRTVATNKTRFVTKTIGGDDIVIDRATGLMWPKDFAGTGGNGGVTKAWGGPGGAVSWGWSLTFAGYTDWRLPNALELISIAVFEGVQPYVYSIFDNRVNSDFWTSTTRPGLTTNAFFVSFLNPHLAFTLKTFAFRVIATRDSRL